jgi:hypothetical protein
MRMMGDVSQATTGSGSAQAGPGRMNAVSVWVIATLLVIGYALFVRPLEKIRTKADHRHAIEVGLEGPDLGLMSWGEDSGVPTSGKYLVIAGTDSDGLLHIRTFDAAGVRTDTFETRDSSGALHLRIANASGTVLSDELESSLAPIRADAITNLKQQFRGFLPPHVLSNAERGRVLSEVTRLEQIEETVAVGHGQTFFRLILKHFASVAVIVAVLAMVGGILGSSLGLPGLFRDPPERDIREEVVRRKGN